MRLSKLLALSLTFAATSTYAAGPRWYTGVPYYTAAPGQPVAFFTPDVTYFTDPGPLNANVTHAQADAMVAAAAAVWNISAARLTLKQGGTLAEHLSSANVYFDGQQMVFPDDVKPANYRVKPIAIVYDTDGSVIDTLLGAGASAPSGCRTNGVVEDVDGLDPAGTIDHALLILNGRCVGSTPQQLTQMQYQLMRAFGRVLGLAWSQLNDNVFTGSTTPTALQMANWPVMHPIDVICGTYTYTCMQNPFSLRVDDIASLTLLYPVTPSNIIAGKTLSQTGMATLFGWVRFPTGQGMDAVNVVLQRRIPFQKPDPAVVMSAVSGAAHQQYSGNAIEGAPQGPAESTGDPGGVIEGLYALQYIPIVGSTGWDTMVLTTEPINPLYSGDYAISGYVGQPPKMSGSAVTIGDQGVVHPGDSFAMNIGQTDAASSCNPPPAGTEDAPIPADSTGWWSGLLCGVRASWLSQTVKPGRTWTIEATALDESGASSSLKFFPVIGVYKTTDPLGTAPTVAAAATSLNGRVIGMTQLRMASTSAQQSYRILLTDQRGSARPDFSYNARLLYADTISPAQVGRGGGVVTITGEGFRTGNVVKVNGVNATVLSWTANQIVAITPSMSAANMSAGGQADITVLDTVTGGSTTVQSALSYGGAGVNVVQLISAPATLETGMASAVAFSVRVLLSDGITPARGASVVLHASGASAVFAACNASTCTITADANGVVQSTVLASSAGTLTLTATELSGGASVQAVASVLDPVRIVTALGTDHYIAPNTAGSWSAIVTATQDGLPAAGVPVLWTVAAGLTLGNASPATGSTGQASVTVNTAGLSSGTVASAQGCVWLTVCAAMRVYAIDPASWRVRIESGAGQSVSAAKTLGPVVVQVTDAAGHPIESAPVTVAQTSDAWQGACPATGRCPSSPVLTSSRKTYVTDTNGRFSITPLELAGVASTINITIIAGTNGFVSLSLLKTP